MVGLDDFFQLNQFYDSMRIPKKPREGEQSHPSEAVGYPWLGVLALPL